MSRWLWWLASLRAFSVASLLGVFTTTLVQLVLVEDAAGEFGFGGGRGVPSPKKKTTQSPKKREKKEKKEEKKEKDNFFLKKKQKNDKNKRIGPRPGGGGGGGKPQTPN